MRFNGELAEGKAKTGPSSMTLRCLPEELEDHLVILFGNPASVILDLDDNPGARGMALSEFRCIPDVAVNGNRLVRRAELDGIVYEVLQDAAKHIGIALDLRYRCSVHAEMDATILSHALQALEHGLDYRRNVDWVAFEFTRALL